MEDQWRAEFRNHPEGWSSLVKGTLSCTRGLRRNNTAPSQGLQPLACIVSLHFLGLPGCQYSGSQQPPLSPLTSSDWVQMVTRPGSALPVSLPVCLVPSQSLCLHSVHHPQPQQEQGEVTNPPLEMGSLNQRPRMKVSFPWLKKQVIYPVRSSCLPETSTWEMLVHGRVSLLVKGTIPG